MKRNGGGATRLFYGYARVSTDDQARHGFSLDAQVGAINREFDYLSRNDPTLKMGCIFIERGQSAYKKALHERREGGKLVSVVNPGDVVCVVHIDRLFRQVSDGANYLKLWTDIGIGIRAVGGQFDTSTAMGKAAVQMMLVWAEFASANQGEKIRAAKARKRSLFKNPVPGRTLHALEPGMRLDGSKRLSFADKERFIIARYVLHLRRLGLSREQVGVRLHRVLCHRDGKDPGKSYMWDRRYQKKGVENLNSLAELNWPEGKGGWGMGLIPVGQGYASAAGSR